LTDTTPRHDSLCFADCERTMNPGALPMYGVHVCVPGYGLPQQTALK
jgi:hypothetical protein